MTDVLPSTVREDAPVPAVCDYSIHVSNHFVRSDSHTVTIHWYPHRAPFRWIIGRTLNSSHITTDKKQTAFTQQPVLKNRQLVSLFDPGHWVTSFFFHISLIKSTATAIYTVCSLHKHTHTRYIIFILLSFHKQYNCRAISPVINKNSWSRNYFHYIHRGKKKPLRH